jgi:hypothetical protein
MSSVLINITGKIRKTLLGTIICRPDRQNLITLPFSGNKTQFLLSVLCPKALPDKKNPMFLEHRVKSTSGGSG